MADDKMVQVSILKYTDEEYTRHLAVPEWTKQETDQLMKLTVRFDLNFIMIQVCPHDTLGFEDAGAPVCTARERKLRAHSHPCAWCGQNEWSKRRWGRKIKCGT